MPTWLHFPLFCPGCSVTAPAEPSVWLKGPGSPLQQTSGEHAVAPAGQSWSRCQIPVEWDPVVMSPLILLLLSGEELGHIKG